MDPVQDVTEDTEVTFEPVNGFEVLDKVADLTISTWSYVRDDRKVRHLGPMAQDFAAAFHLGDSDKVIHTVDANGVLLVCVQALHRHIEDLRAEVQRLAEQVINAELPAQLSP